MLKWPCGLQIHTFMKYILHYSLTMGISLHIWKCLKHLQLTTAYFLQLLNLNFCFMLPTELFRKVCGAREGGNLEALPISSSMVTISILFYLVIFCMRGLEDLFLPLSLAQVFLSVHVYPGCTGIVWHALELLRDAFMM